MGWTNRRGFLGSVGAALSTLVLPRTPWPRTPWPRLDLDRTRLGAVAEAVLPSHLGAEGTGRVVDAFLAWLDGYRAGAERSHGYGSGSMEIRYLPPDPGPRWEAQLGELDGIGRQRFASAFADLPLERRCLILGERIGDARISELTSAAEADHVAAALMAFWFGSAEAADLAYGALIGKETCRALGTVGEAPAPIRREGRP